MGVVQRKGENGWRVSAGSSNTKNNNSGSWIGEKGRLVEGRGNRKEGKGGGVKKGGGMGRNKGSRGGGIQGDRFLKEQQLRGT